MPTVTVGQERGDDVLIHLDGHSPGSTAKPDPSPAISTQPTRLLITIDARAVPGAGLGPPLTAAVAQRLPRDSTRSSPTPYR